jgi:hypothetical protein
LPGIAEHDPWIVGRLPSRTESLPSTVESLPCIVACLPWRAESDRWLVERFPRIASGDPRILEDLPGTFVAMEVAAGKILDLAKLSMVALVEQMHGFAPALDISGDAIKVTHSTTYPNNLEDVAPTLRGLGHTLAFIDSGIDDQAGPGTTHDSLPAWKFAGGYDAATQTVGDPDDVLWHGTHIAGIAVGTGAGSGNRGMAPDASLVDCRTSFQNGPTGWLEVIDCFEQILLNAATWGVDVLNASIRQSDLLGKHPPHGRHRRGEHARQPSGGPRASDGDLAP